jgi:hypothetical protein
VFRPLHHWLGGQGRLQEPGGGLRGIGRDPNLHHLEDEGRQDDGPATAGGAVRYETLVGPKVKARTPISGNRFDLFYLF